MNWSKMWIPLTNGTAEKQQKAQEDHIFIKQCCTSCPSKQINKPKWQSESDQLDASKKEKCTLNAQGELRHMRVCIAVAESKDMIKHQQTH